VSKQLPSRPNLEQLKKQAKALLKDAQASAADAVARLREYHPRGRQLGESVTLADAQLVLAREYGFANWTALKEYVLAQTTDPVTEAQVRSLQEAAARGDLARLNTLLEATPSLINEVGGPGVRTALHHAVFGRCAPAAQLLLERGADPNIRCEGDNAYPLHFAAEKNDIAIIRLLIEHGADPIGEGDYHELEVIGWATAYENVPVVPEVVEYLLAHGARHNVYSAVAVGDVEAIRVIVARSPDVLERRLEAANRRRMPLHLAVMKRQPRSLLTLLDLGANPESLDEATFTALDQAAMNGEREMVEILLARGAKLRLPAAIALGRTRDVERLLQRDPESLKPGGRWGTLIVRAAERAPGEVIDALIKAGADVNVHDDRRTAVDSALGYTPLHAAAFNGNLNAVEALLRHGADVRAREERWHGTPGGWASYAGHTAVHDRIVQGPVDIMEAVELGRIDRVEEILRDDPDALERAFAQYPLYPLYAEGWFTPLVFAVIIDKPEMVKFLVTQGANVGIPSPQGKTLRQLAEEKGSEAIAELLPAHPQEE
jgi:ankyrin repeat protein